MQLRVIGATTKNQYRKFIAAARFHDVMSYVITFPVQANITFIIQHNKHCNYIPGEKTQLGKSNIFPKLFSAIFQIMEKLNFISYSMCSFLRRLENYVSAR